MKQVNQFDEEHAVSMAVSVKQRYPFTKKQGPVFPVFNSFFPVESDPDLEIPCVAMWNQGLLSNNWAMIKDSNTRDFQIWITFIQIKLFGKQGFYTTAEAGPWNMRLLLYNKTLMKQALGNYIAPIEQFL